MKEILNEYCHQSNQGLLLLSMPTGFGKTYNVLNFIYSNYKKFAAEKRKIIFITNLKKNLPHTEFKKRFIEDKNEYDFEKYVLFIDSNTQTVIDNLLSLENDIPDDFKKESYSKLKRQVEMLSQISRMSKEIKSMVESEIRAKFEPTFRKFIQGKLKGNFKTKQARLEAIKNNKDYQWIGKLYPAVFTDERTVLFLSIDKFLVKNSTLIEDSYDFYKHQPLINNALIFIDEFDTTKESILKNIIKSGLEHKVNLLGLFSNIHNHLMQNEYPEKLVKESNWRKKKQESSDKKWLSLQEQIDSFKEKANKIFNEYKLQYTCKSHEDFSTKKRNFLFYDYEFHNVLERYQRIKILQDSKNRINWINSVDTKSGKTDVDIDKLLREITGFLTYFQRGIKYLAENYWHFKQENDKLEEAFSLESAVKTVINSFSLESNSIDGKFLVRNIMEINEQYGSKNSKKVSNLESLYEFYEKGFCYYDIVDSDEHDTLSKIYMIKFNRTPESFLVEVCSKAMVVGISATAGLYTNIGNYDLKYLKSRLGDSFITLKDDDISRLKQDYSEATKGYDEATKGHDKINIKPKLIVSNSDDKDKDKAIKQLEILLDDEDRANALWNHLENAPRKDNKNVLFLFCRYVRLLTAWKYFLDNPDCHGFLCFFNKELKYSDSDFNLNKFYEYADLLLNDKKDTIDGKSSDITVVLNGDNFDEKKKKISQELKDNKRKFIISTYQTIGVGQNLQFPIPSSLETIQINSIETKLEMDINGIYLDKPTNLLVNLSNDSLKDEDFIKYIFQLEFLRENGDISQNTFKSKLDEVFKKFVGIAKYQKGENLYNTKAYALYLNKIIIQAIGRICRTNRKSPIIHVLADDSIAKYLNKYYLPENVIPVREYTKLREYTELLNSIGESSKEYKDLKESQNIASLKSNQTAAYIHTQLNTKWTNEGIKEWQNLREQVLRQPAIEKESECDVGWKPIYIQLPEANNSYYFSEENDFREVEVFFSKKEEVRKVSKVSEETARLTELMKIDILRELFIASGWATTFPKSELILTPPIFNNIYKGALGEVCGKRIFENFFKIPLQELDIDEFELFDFKTDKNIYIDFKLWNARVAVEAEKQMDKIRNKIEKTEAERVFIINILGSPDTPFHPIPSDDGKIVRIPYLCKNDKIDEEAIIFIMEEFAK